ncbi:sensor histidine kinase [Moritella sp. F3]|uniref:ATP-binding protein n=1 Tax=Moritella sp. F3 TaxID=2718882 RepID=UPI001A2299D3|nr:sensor histidine kinase [Moritella sp. F3]GIC78820.1 histidine kinase [Moritella sp. F1]GIC81945.1 histidine kinase [Moritella sp. F3]
MITILKNNALFNWQKLSFRRRLLLIMTLSGIVKLLILSIAGFIYLKHWEEQDSGNNALGIAKFLSTSPCVVKAIETNNPELIRNKIEYLRASVNAAFIVVGNKDGIRLSHPIDARIGKPMKGDDNDRALKQGLSYVSVATGSLGRSVRGKTPIIDSKGNIIGVVSVGYLLTSIESKADHFLIFLLIMITLVVLTNALISNFTAKKFQNAIFGFEPEEFGRLYMELEVTLSTIKEGVVSIDANGYLRSINRSACDIFKVKAENVLNHRMDEVLPENNLTEILTTKANEYNVEMMIKGQAIVANRQILIVDNQVVGAVSSFRLKDEISELTKQLSQVREYSDLLRSQTHEHSNKLNTISGLIHLGKNEEVLGLIGQETERYQHLIEFLREAIHEPMIAGVLLGKSERARELGLLLDIDDGSQLLALPEHIRAEDLVTILGNFIDNGFDACISSNTLKSERKVSVSISDFGDEIIMEVEDNGCGLPEGIAQQELIKQGVSSKSDSNRGVGLHLVDKIINQYNGQLMMESIDNKGTRMTVYLPKQHADKDIKHDIS